MVDDTQALQRWRATTSDERVVLFQIAREELGSWQARYPRPFADPFEHAPRSFTEDGALSNAILAIQGDYVCAVVECVREGEATRAELLAENARLRELRAEAREAVRQLFTSLPRCYEDDCTNPASMACSGREDGCRWQWCDRHGDGHAPVHTKTRFSYADALPAARDVLTSEVPRG